MMKNVTAKQILEYNRYIQLIFYKITLLILGKVIFHPNVHNSLKTERMLDFETQEPYVIFCFFLSFTSWISLVTIKSIV